MYFQAQTQLNIAVNYVKIHNNTGNSASSSCLLWNYVVHYFFLLCTTDVPNIVQHLVMMSHVPTTHASMFMKTLVSLRAAVLAIVTAYLAQIVLS